MKRTLIQAVAAILGAPALAFVTPPVIQIAGELPAAPANVVGTPIPAAPAAPATAGPVTRCYMQLRYSRHISRWFVVASELYYGGDATVRCYELAPRGSKDADKALEPIELEFEGFGTSAGLPPSWAPSVTTPYFQIRVADPFKPESLAGTYEFDRDGHWSGYYNHLRYRVTGFQAEGAPRFAYDFHPLVNRSGGSTILYAPYGTFAPPSPSVDFVPTLHFRKK
ncbi:MAG: hypothetical protein HY078_07285 [Elusimicrobia bacterium]|nr:hypothetical protein [Elusimicrobiota bacterium]